MPNVKRVIVPGEPHHLTQRGNYRQQIFFRPSDRRLYLDLLREFSREFDVSIQGYCLMPNHVHVIATPHDPLGLARCFERVHSEYARDIHIRLRRRGHLFQARYCSFPMDQEHFWTALVYSPKLGAKLGAATALKGFSHIKISDKEYGQRMDSFRMFFRRTSAARILPGLCLLRD